jgi:hypothetical protein
VLAAIRGSHQAAGLGALQTWNASTSGMRVSK